MADNSTTNAKAADARLIARIREGDGRAARWLVDQHADRIYRYGMKILGNPDDAADITQETFLRLWKNLDNWRPEAPVIHWLQRVAYNLAIDKIRQRRGVSLELLPDLPEEEEDQLDRVEANEISVQVNRAIHALPDRQRAAIVFVHQEGLSNIETAQIMEISVEAVESLLSRGRRRLRELLKHLKLELDGEW